ncbi:hypothetical protein IFR05_014445 [Cadophora sp. M221]|nr:hypothetical protein IFR05_014445 [Cadophora sp. M221]
MDLDPSASDSISLPKTFHPFSRLPAELRMKIWELDAAQPEMVHLTLASGALSDGDVMWLPKAKTILPFRRVPTSPIKLGLACWDARKAVESIRKSHVVSFQRQNHLDWWSWDLSQYRSFSFRMSSKLDTVYLSRLSEFTHFCANSKLASDDDLAPLGGVSAIHSVAVKGIVNLARLSPPSQKDGPGLGQRTRSYAGGEMSKFWPASGFSMFHHLKELIFVHPGFSEMSDDVLQHPQMAGSETVITPQAEDTIRKIAEWKLVVEKEMKEDFARCWLPVDKPEGINTERLIKCSPWWDEPQITLITESELEARFR